MRIIMDNVITMHGTDPLNQGGPVTLKVLIGDKAWMLKLPADDEAKDEWFKARGWATDETEDANITISPKAIADPWVSIRVVDDDSVLFVYHGGKTRQVDQPMSVVREIIAACMADYETEDDDE